MACPDSPPPSRASWSDQGSRSTACRGPVSTTESPSACTHGAKRSARIRSPSASSSGRLAAASSGGVVAGVSGAAGEGVVMA